MDSFDTLPLAALILNSQEKAQFLCVHGGLSPDIETVRHISFLFEKFLVRVTNLLCDSWKTLKILTDSESLRQMDLCGEYIQ